MDPVAVGAVEAVQQTTTHLTKNCQSLGSTQFRSKKPRFPATGYTQQAASIPQGS